MRPSEKRRNVVLFIVLGAVMLGLAIALSVGWVVWNWREVARLSLGIIFFLLLITGVVLNTIFLVREARRNERHDNFINAVTHELKTPIASIRLYLETLQRRQLSDIQREEFYRIMLADSDRLLSTVEQVLKAGEVGQNTRLRIRMQVNLPALVEQCVQRATTRYHLAAEAISLDPGSLQQEMLVRGDPEALETALMNILGNAVKYSPQEAKIRVTVREHHSAWVRVNVTDNGIGIPQNDLKRIFMRFYRVPSRAVMMTKGTGLGLFLVRTIARQHGGDAFAESAGEGTGSTITLQLPRLLSVHWNKEQGNKEQENKAQGNKEQAIKEQSNKEQEKANG
jgi:two-component system sensor histidine kinase SenX3